MGFYIFLALCFLPLIIIIVAVIKDHLDPVYALAVFGFYACATFFVYWLKLEQNSIQEVISIVNKNQ